MNNLKQDLAHTIRSYHQKGWSPATSTNYSFIEDGKIFVSKSGIDKAVFNEDDFIIVNSKGVVDSQYKEFRPSAETLIHCTLYNLFPGAEVILHAHSIYSVLNSQQYEREIIFEGYEIQKGFSGQTSHLDQVAIPIFENSQEMTYFVSELTQAKKSLSNHCFIIRNHGTYAWGKNLLEAKRHLETLEYLLKINWKLNF